MTKNRDRYSKCHYYSIERRYKNLDRCHMLGCRLWHHGQNSNWSYKHIWNHRQRWHRIWPQRILNRHLLCNELFRDLSSPFETGLRRIDNLTQYSRQFFYYYFLVIFGFWGRDRFAGLSSGTEIWRSCCYHRSTIYFMDCCPSSRRWGTLISFGDGAFVARTVNADAETISYGTDRHSLFQP